MIPITNLLWRLQDNISCWIYNKNLRSSKKKKTTKRVVVVAIQPSPCVSPSIQTPFFHSLLHTPSQQLKRERHGRHVISYFVFSFLRGGKSTRESNLDTDDGPCGHRIAGSSSSIGCWRADEMLLLLLLRGAGNGGTAVSGRRWRTVQQFVWASG